MGLLNLYAPLVQLVQLCYTKINATGPKPARNQLRTAKAVEQQLWPPGTSGGTRPLPRKKAASAAHPTVR